MKRKRITILGSTGSIGTQTLEVLRFHPEMFEVEVLTTNSNAKLLIEQAIEFLPNAVVVVDESNYQDVVLALSSYPVKVYGGYNALVEIAGWDTTDMVVSALVGFSGLQPTLAALKAGKAVALANKETLVAAGRLITQMAFEKQAPIIPIDSEHSAIFQCLVGEQNEVEKIYLTASGGPFLYTKAEDLHKVTKEQALKHPNWTMGTKITIDSATMMNKGFEVIEAYWLFGIDRIEVTIHPQSIVHSMIQFTDGSVKAQMGLPDMKLPIQYALSFPQRLNLPGPKLDFSKALNMEFFPPDTTKFPCLTLAYDSLRQGGNMACAMNAANEIAVSAFLADKIKFTNIAAIVERTMQKIDYIAQPSFEDLQQTDMEARKIASQNF
jgi:1-deoxy-D-xylulose-5-phosphate reductoisomerase